jgi:hypothetical protein
MISSNHLFYPSEKYLAFFLMPLTTKHTFLYCNFKHASFLANLLCSLNHPSVLLILDTYYNLTKIIQKHPYHSLNSVLP